MNFILFDGPSRDALLPFTYTRPVADIRIGILTIRQKWEKYLGITTSTVTEDYLSTKYPMVELENNVFIWGAVLPTKNLVAKIKGLKENQCLVYEDNILAFFAKEGAEDIDFDSYEQITIHEKLIVVTQSWHIFEKNGAAIEADFELLTEGRKSQPISETNNVIAPENVFIEEGASVECCILNASTGPIYIGEDALVMEGSIIRGPFALGNSGVVKMGAKIYGPTTAGPHCKIGGEIQNSVLFAYSNKGHDGYLGNSVLGEWCNIGADSNTSNLKNNYAEVRLWDYETEGFARTGLQFCGLMMGDHSKCGINTMFNTGTVVGVSANIFGAGFPRNFIPSYSWGGSAGVKTYLTNKAFETARAMMDRRGLDFDAQEEAIMQEVFEQTKKWRKD
ncbi:MAG: GlmU family protein [Flavobacteriaceae bacterium]|nr:GlmU family protein [Flavobacteriaceae bacterium]